ncbi:MAG TPA: O-antigen ligase family protein [bacterium]|nr:O-antigen ligase family protein [bacterium]
MASSASRTAPKAPTLGIGGLFLFLLPLVTLVPYGPMPLWLTQDFLLRWAAALFFIVVMAHALKGVKSPFQVQLDSADILLFLLAVWVLLAALTSATSFQAFYSFRGFLALLLFWSGLRLLWSEKPWIFERFEWLFFGTALVAALFVLADVVGTNLHLLHIDALNLLRQGTFPNQNIAAGYLGMALLWGAYQKLHGRRVPWWTLGFLLVVWGLTESRGAFAAMTLAVVLYLVLNMREVEQHLVRWKMKQWSIFGGAVLFLGASVSLMVNRLLNGDAIDPRAYFRLDVWLSTLKMIKAQPLFGFGPGTYGDVYPYFRPASLWNTSNPFAHNEFLQVAAECGLPALLLVLLLLAVLLAAFRPSGGARPTHRLLTSRGSTAEFTFYLLVFEALHNCVDFTFHEWSHRLILLGFVTFALREKGAVEPMSADLKFAPLPFWGMTTAAFLFVSWALGVGTVRDGLSRLYDLRSVLAQNRGDWAGAEDFARRSLAFRPNNDDPWNSLGAVEVYRGLSAKDHDEREKFFNEADEDFQTALHYSPYTEEPKTNRIQSLLQRGRWSQALELQKKLVAEGPRVPTHFTELARILTRLGRAKEAVGPAQQAIDQFPYFLPAYFAKAQALEALGRRTEALHTYEDARQMLKNIDQEDPSGQVQPNIDRLQGHP